MVLLTTTPQILEILSSLPPSALATLSTTIPKLPPSSTPTPVSRTDTDREADIDPLDPSDTTTSSISEPPSIHQPLPTTLANPISHTTLIALSRLRFPDDYKSKPTIPSLNTLLRGTRPYTPPPPPPTAKTPGYLALMARLRAEEEQRQYTALLTKQRRRSSLSLSLADSTDEEEDDTLSPTLVLNILLSVILCAVAVFQLTKYWPNDGVRVLLSLGTGIVVGVAEAGVYSIYLVKKKRGKERERRKVERKSFVGRVERVESSGAEVRIVKVGEGDVQEEIWGRGVNGGMRRRVREKWEKEREKERGTEEKETAKEK